MHVLQVRNVHQALPEGIRYLSSQGRTEETRNGLAWVSPCPVTTVYEKPEERVIFWKKRDANPFFHLMESLWMMGGRNDVEFLKMFSGNIGNYSDDGEIFNAAYGYRWKNHFGQDQIKKIIENLKANPKCRRQVLGIWDARHDLGLDSKDIPCNLAVHFMAYKGELDMTVFNRSNDMVWGTYGANAVHFSILQEFVARLSGFRVGQYYQISDNYHAYHSTFVKVASLIDEAKDPYRTISNDPYERGNVAPFPVATEKSEYDSWMFELKMVLEEGPNVIGLKEPFFRRVIIPLLKAWTAYKSDDPKRFTIAQGHVQNCAAGDWRLACGEWLNRRAEKAKNKGLL